MRAAVYSGTRNVYEQMYTSMKSLITNSQIDRIYFLIEDDVFPYKLPSKVKCLNISDQIWIAKDCPNINPWWGGIMNLIRLALAKLFPTLDKILSLDIDTIIVDDISELWDLDMSNYYIAGARDIPQYNKAHLYVNGGVILYNLDKMRQDGIDNKLLEVVHREKRRFAMQDPLNEVMQGKILELPSRYNGCHAFVNYNPNDVKIYHYAGDRKYTDKPLVQHYKDLVLDQSYFNETRAAVYCGTRNIYKDMIPSMQSLLKYSNVETIYFLIEDDKFPYKLPPEVKCINVSNQQFFSSDGPNFTSKWSYMILLRAALAKIFPNLDRILSLDCDTIVRNNISNLWDMNLDNYYLAGVCEPEKSTVNFHYLNAGVLLFNLKKIREDHKDDEYIDNLNNCFRYYPEQECFSALSQERFLELPSEYNLSCVTASSTNEKIIHFAANKNWKNLKLVQEFADLPIFMPRNQTNDISLDIIILNYTTEKQLQNTLNSITKNNKYPVNIITDGSEGNNAYILYLNCGDTLNKDSLDKIFTAIENASVGYVYMWNNEQTVFKREFINRYNIKPISNNNYSILRLGRILLDYLKSLEHINRLIVLKDSLYNNTIEDFSTIVETLVNSNYYIINFCKINKIPMSYVIRELNYMIVRLYGYCLFTIQEHSEFAEKNWQIIKSFYDKCYSKYELTASQTLAEPYYKYNTQIIMPKMKTWKHQLRININRFLQELKSYTTLPERYKYD